MGRRLLKHAVDVEIKPLSSKEGEISVSSFLELYEKFLQQKTLEGLKERTIKDYGTHFKYVNKYIDSEHRSIGDRLLDIDFLRSYIYFMKEEKKLNAFTINTRLRTLKCYLKWLHDEGYLKTPLYCKIKLQKTQEDTVQPLSDIDIKKMLKAPDKNTFHGYRDFCLMVTMLDCGIRTLEALNIEANDIDLKQGIINVWGNISKTGLYRQVPISNKTCKLLQNLIKNNNPSSAFVFQSTYGGKRMDTNAIVHALEKYARQVNVNVRATGHVWRHTFSVNYIKSGGDAFTLQRILGHTTMSTVRKYVQLGGTDVKQKHESVAHLKNFL